MEEVIQTQGVMSSNPSNPSTHSLHQAVLLLSKGRGERGNSSTADRLPCNVNTSAFAEEFIWKIIVFLLQDSLLIT